MDWNQFKTDWVKALRSGEYVQAKGTLCLWGDATAEEVPECLGFCCLGVAAEMIEPGITDVEWIPDSMSEVGWRTDGGGYLRHEVELGDQFIEAHGLDKLMQPASEALKLEAVSRGIAVNVRTDTGYSQVQDVLMCLNDSSQCTFEDMANIIERHL